MDAGLVTSLSGALAQSRRVDSVANNLANAATPGFKADDVDFEESLIAAHKDDTRTDLPDQGPNDSELLSRAGTERSVVLHGKGFTNLSQGQMQVTNAPLDFAIEGNGFFEVLSPAGIRLTRAGNLALDPGGRLVTKDGFLVLGPGQPGQDPSLRAIQIPPGHFTVDREGGISDASGAPVSRIGMVQVANPDALKKEGHSLYVAGPDAVVQSPGQPAAAAPRAPASDPLVPQVEVQGVAAKTPKANPMGSLGSKPILHQGMIETSNVNAVQEMTKLIQAQRMFEQNAKLMQTFGELDQRAGELGKF